MSKRISYLDLLRITACFLVVLTHSVMENKPENGIWLGFISILCSPSSELFLALSGAILLPIHLKMEDFYKRRFIKLLPPMIIWSLFGIGLRLVLGRISPSSALISLLSLPFKPVIGVYWFLYVMVGLYLLAPFISYWLDNSTKKQVEFFIIIWLINMIIPWFNLIIPGFYNPDGSYYWPLCYFGGFLGYWMLGYYLKNYPIELKSLAGTTCICLSILYLLTLVVLKFNGIDYTPYYDNLQIGSAFLVSTLFIFAKEISKTKIGELCLNEYASKLAQYSFGVYLIHTFIVRDCVWKIMENNRLENNPLIESLLITIVSIAICIFVIRFLTFIYKPSGKWLFGIK